MKCEGCEPEALVFADEAFQTSRALFPVKTSRAMTLQDLLTNPNLKDHVNLDNELSMSRL